MFIKRAHIITIVMVVLAGYLYSLSRDRVSGEENTKKGDDVMSDHTGAEKFFSDKDSTIYWAFKNASAGRSADINNSTSFDEGLSGGNITGSGSHAAAGEPFRSKTNILNTGYGMFVPFFEYGKRYKRSRVYSMWLSGDHYIGPGLIPEFHLRYSSCQSRSRRGKVSSSFSLFQTSIGLMYPYKTGIKLFKNNLTVYGRITEGITRISFEYGNNREQIVEYINTMEISAGVIYPFAGMFLAGFDLGYRHIAAKNVPFQSFNLMLTAGVRI